MRRGEALAYTHARPSFVGTTPEDASRPEIPLVAVGRQAGPVPVGHAGDRGSDALDRRVDGALRWWSGSRPDRRRYGPGHERTGPVPDAADDAGDSAAAVPFDVGHGDAEPHAVAGGGSRVDDDRVKDGAPRRVQGAARRTTP